MKAETILKQISENQGKWSFEGVDWLAIANGSTFIVSFDEGKWAFSLNGTAYRAYKNAKSFAQRVSRLIRTGL